LFGLTVHIGTLEMGHYIAVSKRHNRWFYFDDENYQEISESEALN